MPFDGGNFVRSRRFVDDAAAGLNAEAGFFDQEFDNFAGGMETLLPRDGSAAASGNLPMAGFRHTNVGPSTGTGQYATVDQVVSGFYGRAILTQSTDGNSFTGNMASGALQQYTDGQQITLWPDFANTSGVTINLNNLGQSSIVLNLAGDPLPANTLQPGIPFTIIRQSGYWVALNVRPAAINLYAPDGQVKLEYISSTTLQVVKSGGGIIKINGVTMVLPDDGVTITNAGLVANALYYVYLKADRGVISGNIVTFPPASDADGNLSNSNDFTQRLVGMVQTGPASQFINSSTQKWVRSFFNDNGINERVAPTVPFVDLAFPSPSTVTPTTNFASYLLWDGESVTLNYQFRSRISSTNSADQGVFAYNAVVNGAVFAERWRRLFAIFEDTDVTRFYKKSTHGMNTFGYSLTFLSVTSSVAGTIVVSVPNVVLQITSNR